MVPKEIEGIIIRYVRALQKRKIHVDSVFIYGSYAQGRAGEESDIDVAIVSKDFGKDRFEEGSTLRQIAWRIDSRIEPVPISKESFSRDDWIPLIYEIKTNGVQLKIAA